MSAGRDRRRPARRVSSRLARSKPADAELVDELPDDDREASRSLACCILLFVARLPSPYRKAVTLVELQGLTVAEAGQLVGISLSGMKSRVQRGRARLRRLFEECCEIGLDARGKVIHCARRRPCGACT